jgi:hypothetical protein
MDVLTVSTVVTLLQFLVSTTLPSGLTPRNVCILSMTKQYLSTFTVIQLLNIESLYSILLMVTYGSFPVQDL